MGGYNEPLIPKLFPQSITSIKFKSFDQPTPAGYFYNYSNLKLLKINLFHTRVIPENKLPLSLELLDLGHRKGNFYMLIHYHHYQQKQLGHLKNGGVDEIINNDDYTFKIENLNNEFGQPPSSITSLTLYSDTPIPVGSLPCNLKELY